MSTISYIHLIEFRQIKQNDDNHKNKFKHKINDKHENMIEQNENKK